jgi:hypothetical protein
LGNVVLADGYFGQAFDIAYRMFRMFRRSKVSLAQLRRSLTAWLDWTYRAISRCQSGLRLFLTAHPAKCACLG